MLLPDELLVHVLRFLCAGRREAKLWHMCSEDSWGNVPVTVEFPDDCHDDDDDDDDGYDRRGFGVAPAERNKHLDSKDAWLKMQVYDDGPHYLCDHHIPLSDNPTSEEFDVELGELGYMIDRLGMEDDDLVLHSGATHTEEEVNDPQGEAGECRGTITVIGAFLGDAGVRFVKAPPKQLRLSRRIQEDLTIRATFFYRMEKFAETDNNIWDTLLISTVDLTKPGNYTLDSNFNVTQISTRARGW
jgi:hypothetical protein